MIDNEDVEAIQARVADIVDHWEAHRGVLLIFYDAKDGHLMVSGPEHANVATILKALLDKYETDTKPDMQKVTAYNHAKRN
jgi:hypothetical protein